MYISPTVLNRWKNSIAIVACLCGMLSIATHDALRAQSDFPAVIDPNLSVRAVVGGLDQPITMAFLGPNDFLVLEKASGKVKRVINGAVHSTVLDLAVNSGSERGLLGIALHPSFPEAYLYWTESTTGADTTVLSETPLLGNRSIDSIGTARG